MMHFYQCCLHQCFSTGVPRNLRVLPMVSKGSAGLPVLSKKIKLRPTFTATGCIFQALSRSKVYLRSGLHPRSRPSALNFGPLGLTSPLKKDMGSVSNQNCCKGFRFTKKVEKHWFTEFTTKEAFVAEITRVGFLLWRNSSSSIFQLLINKYTCVIGQCSWCDSYSKQEQKQYQHFYYIVHL